MVQNEFNKIVEDTCFQQELGSCKIKLIAPSSGTEQEKLDKLKSLPFFNINIPDDLNTQTIIYHSNSDEERLRLLIDALYDESEETIIWQLKGGYGSARLIDALLKMPKPKKEKRFIGFSDITALHIFLTQHWQWKPIHGAGLLELINPARHPDNFYKLMDIIYKRNLNPTISGLKLLNPKVNSTFLSKLNSELNSNLHCNKNNNAINSVFSEKISDKITRKITGKITGGNLTIVQTSLGTPWQIQTDNKILFLEDVGEKGYYIDRALNHLRQAGVLKNVNAVIFGEFYEPRDDKTDIALNRFASEMNFPVFKTDYIGHGKHNHPIVYHAESEIIEMKDEDSESFDLKMHLS